MTNDMVTSHALHRFTVLEYHRMYAAGVFAPSARMELIDGDLVESLVKMKPPLAAGVIEITRALMSALKDKAQVRAQVPITLGDFSEPEPDISIVRISLSRYKGYHPGASDILALIEVADSSRAFDLGRKVPLYAASGIPETWIIDLVDSQTYVFRDPRDRSYVETSTVAFDEEVVLEAFPEARLKLSNLL